MEKQKKIILPKDEDGVANLEIRRIQSEIEKQATEYVGGMPEEAQERLIDELENCLEAAKQGNISSVCLAYIGEGIHPFAQGLATIITEQTESEKLMEIVMMALESRIGGPDGGEAG